MAVKNISQNPCNSMEYQPSSMRWLQWFFLAFFILLSGCSSRQGPAPVVDIKGNIPLNQRAKGGINSAYYQVKKGETLYSIAWRANSDVRTLAKINHLTAPYHIFPNQKIYLTEKSARASTDKRFSKNQNKSSGQTTKNSQVRAIDLSKKQAYGKVVARKKHNSKQPSKAKKYSTKVKRWLWPAKGKVIEKFSSAINGNSGINIAGSRGDNIVSSAAGKVVYAGDALRGYGNLVIIKHNEDYLSAYAHNDRILVKEQQTVKAGDVIAKMGNSDAERTMLHFEVRFRGKSVNPLKYLPRK